MNTKQRILLLIGALVFVALGLYPPWQSVGSSVGLTGFGETAPAAEAFHRSLGYALIFKPPKGDSSIDLSRLTVEWLCVIVLAGSLIAVLGKGRGNAK